MHRYWNDPEVLKKLGSAMGDSVMPAELAGAAGGVPPGWPGAAGENGAAGGEAEGEEEEEEHNVHSAASTGACLIHLGTSMSAGCTLTAEPGGEAEGRRGRGTMCIPLPAQVSSFALHLFIDLT